MTSEVPEDDLNVFDLEGEIRGVVMMAGIIAGLHAEVHRMLISTNSGVQNISEHHQLDFAIYDLLGRADDLRWTFGKVAEAEERRAKPAA